MLGYGSNQLLVQELRGLGTGVSPKDAPSAWSLLLRFTLHGADIWKASKVFLPSFMLYIFKCTSHSVDTVLAAARYTVSTSRAARRRMTAWRNENEGCFWAVKLDVRDLGGHLDVTLRALAGNLSSTVKSSHHSGHCSWSPMGFQRLLGMLCSKYLPGGLHGCEGAAISVGALGAFRATVARAVWSKKLPMTNTPALLSLFDGPCPGSWPLLGFRGSWLDSAWPPSLPYDDCPVQHFRSAIWRP